MLILSIITFFSDFDFDIFGDSVNFDRFRLFFYQACLLFCPSLSIMIDFTNFNQLWSFLSIYIDIVNSVDFWSILSILPVLSIFDTVAMDFVDIR